MAPRTVYANLSDGLQNLSLWDQSLADMGALGVTPCTAAGTDTIVLTPIVAAYAPAVSSPPNQLQAFSFVATATSTGAVTVNGLKLYKEDATSQAGANDILVNVLYGVIYNSALNGAVGGYQIVFPVTSIINPVISGATITNSTYNGNTWTTGTGTLTIAAGKTETFNNTLTFAGTDGTTMTFPTTSATIARTDAANTFTGHQTIEGVTSTGATGTGRFVFDNTPTLITPNIGVATATSINGNTFTTGTYTLTGTAAKTLNFTNSLTLSGTDGSTMTFPSTSATIARTDAGNTFTGTQNFASLTISSAVATDASKNLVSVTNTGSGNNVLATAPTLNQAILNGVTTNTAAGAGVIGQVISSSIPAGSAVSLASSTAKDVTTISLTAGNWLVWGNVVFAPGATTTQSTIIAYINTTANTLPTLPNGGAYTQFSASLATGGNQSIPAGMMVLSLSATTTVSLGAFSTFGVSTQTAYGAISAVRFF
jgi:hypothetical protein